MSLASLSRPSCYSLSILAPHASSTTWSPSFNRRHLHLPSPSSSHSSRVVSRPSSSSSSGFLLAPLSPPSRLARGLVPVERGACFWGPGLVFLITASPHLSPSAATQLTTYLHASPAHSSMLDVASIHSSPIIPGPLSQPVAAPEVPGTDAQRLCLRRLLLLMVAACPRTKVAAVLHTYEYSSTDLGR